METLLDNLWGYIVSGMQFLGNGFYGLLQHLHFLGPVLVIALLAVLTVALTKVLTRIVNTSRYVELEGNYQHWLQLREEAMKCEDSEKGRRMARNIDQAELNKAYYDYFFEGFLLNIVRKVVPIFFMFGFINEFYQPEQMESAFGTRYVFQFTTAGGESMLVGAAFWFVISLLLCYLGWPLVKRMAGGRGVSIPASVIRPVNDSPGGKC